METGLEQKEKIRRFMVETGASYEIALDYLESEEWLYDDAAGSLQAARDTGRLSE